MKKNVLALILVLAAVLAAAPLAAAEKNRADLTVIRKAVADAPATEPAARPRWFKLVVTDDRCHKDVVKLSLPIGLCELFLSKCRDTKVKLNHHLSEIDLDEIWTELKHSLPRTVIEVSGPKETVKIWFE
jgi:hypothetical protein